MSSETRPDVANAEFLTDVLRRSGTIGDAHVRDVVVESSRGTLLSRIIRLRLSYDAIVPDAPLSLLLKTGLAGAAITVPNLGRQEVAFYTRVAPVLTAGLIPVCFDASWNDATSDWHLLLEDLTDTHVIATTWPLPPTLEQCEIIIDARARCHAEFWDDPRLGDSIGIRFDAAAAEQYQRDLAGHFTHFVDQLGDRLPRGRRELFERFLDVLPRLLARRRSGQNMTIVHGDAHVWNSFLPRREGDTARLFDWDGWRIGVASGDLAYMMALHWYPDRRQQLERPLLDRYHATLVANGVRGYDRQALDDDYRLSALMQIATPVWQAAFNLPPLIWWSHLERVMLAVDDLGCRDLLA